MQSAKIFGLLLFVTAMAIFTAMITLTPHTFSENLVNEQISKKYHKEAILKAAEELKGKTFSNNLTFIPAMKKVLNEAKDALDKSSGVDPANGVWNAVNLPEGVSEGEYRMYDSDVKSYLFSLTKYSAGGIIANNTWLFFFLTFILGIIGALIYFMPKLAKLPGIQNNHIYHSVATRGSNFWIKAIGIFFVVLSTAIGGFGKAFLPTILSIVAGAIILFLVYRSNKQQEITVSTSRPTTSEKGFGWIGLFVCLYFIGFYVLLYFNPHYLTNWTLMLDPISKSLSGGAASQWFLYGFLYTVIMTVMGIRMLYKYRHNKYQLVRTSSVVFFQLAFAFLIPEFLVRLNQPYMDLKNAWPLNYNFFYDYNINQMVGGGTEFAIAGWATSVGTIMFVWGIVLSLIIIPLFTYIFGKRWYCSWVCGCGGLAETLGDPYRQLSDKSLSAWKYERYIIHSVLAFAVIMTGMVLYTYWTGNSQILFFDSFKVRSWYGFFIGSMFAGVVGTGFYPIMGNRVWCRFGCPLAALMGIVQRFKSRFRITTNGGQCISCGNCSTYCEMGIDVRSYAQRGQNVLRASCVGCGICAAVCPRGVLRLENSSEGIDERTTELKTLHITADGISMEA